MTDHDRSGWHNWCAGCGAMYWVRAADLGAAKMRRFDGPESDVRHECRKTEAVAADYTFASVLGGRA